MEMSLADANQVNNIPNLGSLEERDQINEMNSSNRMDQQNKMSIDISNIKTDTKFDNTQSSPTPNSPMKPRAGHFGSNRGDNSALSKSPKDAVAKENASPSSPNRKRRDLRKDLKSFEISGPPLSQNQEFIQAQ